MIELKLALRNLWGAGLRTWLNVFILSLAFVMIIGMQGLFEGMNRQVSRSMTDIILGGGQYWHENYDPYDPLSLKESHAPVPENLRQRIRQGRAAEILIVQGSVYPEGRFQPVLLKGIPPEQEILTLPTQYLAGGEEGIPALIGTRMAQSSGLEQGSRVTVRWRDINGTFDARDIRISGIMETSVQAADSGQIWLPLDILQGLTRMPGQATLVVLAQRTSPPGRYPGWEFKNLDFLLEDIQKVVKSKTAGAAIMYVVLMALAMLAIFNTQVLSIFRRRREMGMLMALGFTRGRVVRLFTLEGALHSLLAVLVGAVYGIPLLRYFSASGWALPEAMDSYGIALGEKLYAYYSLELVIGTTLLVFIVTTVVSFLPTRKIAKLKPTDALRGRFS